MKSLCFIASFKYVMVEKSLKVLRYSFSEKTSTFHTLQLGKLHVGFCKLHVKLGKLHVDFKCFDVVHPVV